MVGVAYNGNSELVSVCGCLSLFTPEASISTHIHSQQSTQGAPKYAPIVLPCGTRWLKSTHRTSAHDVRLRGVPDEVSGVRCRIFIDAHVPGPGPINR